MRVPHVNAMTTHEKKEERGETVGTPTVTLVSLVSTEPRRMIDGVDGSRAEILATASMTTAGTARMPRASVAGARDDAPFPVAS